MPSLVIVADHVTAGGRSVSARVYRELKNDIITCALRPGAHVFEGQLAERYRCSKTPVREALNTLQQEGYVQVIPRRGYVIAPVSVQDIQQIFAARILLEPAAAELAAQRITGEELRRLSQLAKPRKARNPDEMRAANRAFHLAIAEASGNRRLASFIGMLLEEVQRIYHLGLQLGEVMGREGNGHLALITALMKGDHHFAREIMAESIQATRTQMMQALIGSAPVSALEAPLSRGAAATVPRTGKAARRVASSHRASSHGPSSKVVADTSAPGSYPRKSRQAKAIG